MSLVVHKLVLSPDGAAATTQTPPHHVTLAAYAHTRSNVGDAMVRSPEGPACGSMSAHSSSSPYSSSSSSSKHSSTYNLPFVLQDHNYGAPPPPTPPQSPPPVPCSSSSSSGSSPYQLPLHHQPAVPHASPQVPSQPGSQNLLQPKTHSHPLHHHPLHHPQASVAATSPSRPAHMSHTGHAPPVVSSGSSVPITGLLTSHPLSTMPPHRQQFMPHPKTSMFPSPHIPPPPVELLHSPTAVAVAPPPSSTGAETDDDSRLSDRSSSVGPSGEETETAPEGEGDEQPVDDSITRCVCDFAHDDGYMIQCDRCFVWQHVDCMEIDRENIPDEYLCEACEPRMIDRFKARALQIRRRQEIKAHLASLFSCRLSSSDSDDNMPMCNKSRTSLGKVQERKVVKKKKVKQIKDMKNGRKGPLSLLKKSSSVSCNNNIVPGSEERDRRMLVKTRRRKSSSMSGGEGVSDDSCGGPVERLRAWVEGYEVAVTNHYSPELRARVQAARINGVSPDLRASTQGAVLGHRCKVVENPNPLQDVFDSKILVAATRLTVNTAITEFQGKYLLASQWNAQQPVMGQQYLPYVLQYHMPKEGLTVCVDARTYGNDARFTRRSCRPNAEIRHVVERGSLHLYLVATRDIEEAEEVTLALETANSTLDLVCCLSEEHDCNAPHPQKEEDSSPVHNPPHKKNGLLNNKKTIKKQQLQLQLRPSKRTTSTESRSSDNLTTTVCQSTTPITPVKQRRVSGCGKSPAKSPCVSASSSPEELGKDAVVSAPPTLAVTPETPKAIDKQQQQKMTREERKIAAYMKAFERMEKAAQRRQEMEKKKEEDKSKDPKDKDKKHCDGDEEDWEKTSSADEGNRNTPATERSRRKGKKGRGKGSPQKRNHRLDTTASDLTGDESSCASVGLMSPLGGSVEGIALNFNSPPSGNSNVMGFRFPKTKKALMNEWLNETVDPVMPVGSPSGVTEVHSTGVPTCYMRSPATPLRRSTSVNQVVPGTVLNLDLPGGSAKKRWLRQAISEETESPQLNGLCPSPNSRPDSPTGGDYITPLKKRRLARESMSSEQSSTPPSTPVHSTSMEEDKMMEEMEAELAAGGVVKIKCEEESIAEDQSLQGEDHTGDAADTKDSLGVGKREEEDDDGEEELIIEEEEKISNLKDRGRTFITSSPADLRFEKENRRNIKEADFDLTGSASKTDIPLCLSSPKICKEREEKEGVEEDDEWEEEEDEDEDDEEDQEEEEEEEATSSRGEECEVKRRKKQAGWRRKKRQQALSKRERKQAFSTKKKNTKRERHEEELKSKKEDALAVKEESTQETPVGKRESDVGCGNISEENVDERTPKEEGEKDGSTGEKVEEKKERKGVEVKCEIGETDGNPEPAFRSAPKAGEVGCVKLETPKAGEVGCVKLETQGKTIKSESGGDAAECASGFQKIMKNELESLIATDCRIIVKKEKEVSELSDEGSDERTENVGNKEEKNPTQCSKPESKLSSKKPISVKVEALNDEQAEEEAVQEKPELCVGEVVGRREQSGSNNSEREEQGKELARADVHHCMVVKEGSTKTNAKAEQVLSRETCIKQEVELNVQFNASVKIEERDNIPQTQSQDSKETEVVECIPTPAKETSPAPEEVLQQEKSLNLVCSPNSSILQGRRRSSQSDSDDLPVVERAQTPEDFHHKASEPKGPRTPEGPAPTSPEESALMPESPRTPESCSTGQGRSPEREASPERTSRARVRGPCTPPSTPPPHQDDSLDGESEREREQQDDCDKSTKSALHAKAAPVKRKLSILEYRKRKSVSSESETRGANGPRDQSPPPLPPPPGASGAPLADTSGSCAPNPVTLPSASTTQELLSSPSAASPAKGSCASAGDSSPDLSLSPIRPLSLSLPAVLDDKLTNDEGRREVESTTQRGDAAAEVSKDIVGSSKNNTGIVATSLPGITTSTATAPTGTASQDVKWNAAPTLLERQRENLTARLRREFGLCISDDDEDKSEGDERDRGHRRHKEKNLPPPPPPPTAPPKNSIFQGREVTVQKVPCTAKGVVTASPSPGSNTSGSMTTSSPSSSTGPLATHTGTPGRLAGLPTHPPGPPPSYPGSGVTPPMPVPPPAVSSIPSSPSGPSLTALPGSQASQVGLTTTPMPALPTLPLPLPNTVVNPVAMDMSSRSSPITQPVGHTASHRPHLSSLSAPGPTGPHLPAQNTSYPTRSYSRGQFSSTASGPLPVYPPSRVAPPQHSPLVTPPPLPPPPPQGSHGLPASAHPQGPPPAPGLSYNGGNYNGLDCSAPGSRGS
ncbi:mediator of DNA damage checkpoint protein 1-like isoform X3 [Penaeus chinensis]|uniref:mediator of DNA damage checkpoint protein 1-like isoform X3 n=1 Tax=Penaeus chinensis TaxID=139456 RepID=UPI001FB700E8|nr:mediator of DNA damage checkpoint protein 1-like isoform X3 [Penaeus chinensis]